MCHSTCGIQPAIDCVSHTTTPRPIALMILLFIDSLLGPELCVTQEKVYQAQYSRIMLARSLTNHRLGPRDGESIDSKIRKIVLYMATGEEEPQWYEGKFDKVACRGL